MGTIKELPDPPSEAHEYDQNQHYSLVSFDKRVLIPEIKLRKSLRVYCMDGLSQTHFKCSI